MKQLQQGDIRIHATEGRIYLNEIDICREVFCTRVCLVALFVFDCYLRFR